MEIILQIALPFFTRVPGLDVFQLEKFTIAFAIFFPSFEWQGMQDFVITFCRSAGINSPFADFRESCPAPAAESIINPVTMIRIAAAPKIKIAFFISVKLLIVFLSFLCGWIVMQYYQYFFHPG